MMKIVRYRYFNMVLHILVWSIVLLFPYLVSDARSGYKIGPIPGYFFTLSGVVHIIIFYTNGFLLYPIFLNRRYWWLYIVSVVLLIFLSVSVKSYILTTWFPNDVADARTHVLFPSVLALMVSVFYRITVDKVRVEKWQQEKEAMQLGVELKLLRSQISPHFLFNVLTNLISLARKKSDQLETSLLMLGGLMRYMLYDAGKKISLQQEVEYLESYVALQKLRVERNVRIVFDVDLPASASNNSIEPMLLIPFVENAFKHGTGFADQPFIHISLSLRDGVLVFEVKNTFDSDAGTTRDASTGIGLHNVRSRLALMYPGMHELVIRDDAGVFSIYLTLKLLP